MTPLQASRRRRPELSLCISVLESENRTASRRDPELRSRSHDRTTIARSPRARRKRSLKRMGSRTGLRRSLHARAVRAGQAAHRGPGPRAHTALPAARASSRDLGPRPAPRSRSAHYTVYSVVLAVMARSRVGSFERSAPHYFHLSDEPTRTSSSTLNSGALGLQTQRGCRVSPDVAAAGLGHDPTRSTRLTTRTDRAPRGRARHRGARRRRGPRAPARMCGSRACWARP